MPPGLAQLVSITPRRFPAKRTTPTAWSSAAVRPPWTNVPSSAVADSAGALPYTQRANSIPWQPMSISTPPPARSGSQNQSECGPKCCSPWRTRCTAPSAPSSASSLARTYLGAKQSSSAYMSSVPARSHAAIISSASASVRASGFSQITCLPAEAAATVMSRCRSLGAPMQITSTSSCSISAR